MHKLESLNVGVGGVRSALALVGDRLEELGQMGLLVPEELDLSITLLAFDFLALLVALVDGFDLRLQLRNLVLKLRLLVLELLDGLLQVGLAVLSLQLLAHRERDGRLVERLIGADSHLDLVANSEQQQAALGLGQRNLADDLIEALREELLTHRADSRLAGLSVHELGVEVLSQASNVDAGSGRVRHILDVMLSVLDPLGRRKDRVQNVLTRRLSVKRRQLLLLGA